MEKKRRKKNQHQENGCFKKETCCFVSCFLTAAAFSMKRKEKAVSECEKLKKKAMNEPQIFIL